MIRDVVWRFVRLGPLASEQDDSESRDEVVDEVQQALLAITMPVTDDEARLLMACFGDDGCFGLAWTLLHLVESSPSSVVTAEPQVGANEWIARLWLRYRNSLADQEAAAEGL